jgi:signal transduction histidine kinase
VVAAKIYSLPSQVGRVLFGPWPIVLGPLFGVTILVYIVSGADAIGGTQSNGSRFLIAALVGLYSAAMLILGISIAMRLLSVKKREEITRTQYLIIAVTGGLFLAVGRFSVYHFDFIPYSTNPVPILYFIRGLFYSLISLSLIGYIYASLSQATVRADALAAQLQKQNAMMVSEDEKLRSSVAQFLHDRVQAQIMAVSLQLQHLVGKSDVSPEVASGGASLVVELERIRSEDLRSAIRSLSPDISTIGLPAALRELAQTYEPNLAVTLNVDVDQIKSESREIVELACYRIVEQSLVNCVVHGAATRADVHIACTSPMILIEVSDNGSGISQDVVQGRGLSLVESWTHALGGSWEFEPGLVRGARLTCRLNPQLNEQLS